jgi:hypothetical protein
VCTLSVNSDQKLENNFFFKKKKEPNSLCDKLYISLSLSLSLKSGRSKHAQCGNLHFICLYMKFYVVDANEAFFFFFFVCFWSKVLESHPSFLALRIVALFLEYSLALASFPSRVGSRSQRWTILFQARI